MRLTAFFVVVLVVALLFVIGEAEIVELDSSNYEEMTKDGVWFVDFYGKRCGHCKLLDPNLEILAKRAELEGLGFRVAKVDVHANLDLARSHGVKGFPGLYAVSGDNRHAMPDSRGQFVTGGVENIIGFVHEKFPHLKKEVKEL